jgi:hypothetical protein
MRVNTSFLPLYIHYIASNYSQLAKEALTVHIYPTNYFWWFINCFYHEVFHVFHSERNIALQTPT